MNRFLISLLLLPVTLANVHAELQLGIEPRGGIEDTVKAFQPLAEYLSNELGDNVNLKIATDFDSFGAAFSTRQYDVAFAAPATILYHASAMNQPLQWLAVALDRDLGATLKGIFIVHQESPMTRIEDLAGKRIAYVDKSSQGYLMLSNLLRSAHINPQSNVQSVFMHKLNPAVTAVINKEVDAAGVGDVIFSKLKGKINLSLLRVIAASPATTNWTMVSLDAKRGNSIKAALLKLHRNSAEAAAVLVHSQFSGFTDIQENELEHVRHAVAAHIEQDN